MRKDRRFEDCFLPDNQPGIDRRQNSPPRAASSGGFFFNMKNIAHRLFVMNALLLLVLVLFIPLILLAGEFDILFNPYFNH